MAVIYRNTPPPKKKSHFQGWDSEYYGCETLTYWFLWLGGRGFKILWMQYIEKKKKKNPNNFKGGDSEEYSFKTMTYWFPWLGGGGSKYYGCDISNPQNTFSGWGFRILWF
jgi:hypothetical protein